MCKALEEWEEKIRQEERQKERQESIRFNIRTCKKFNIDKDAARTEYHGRIFTIRAESHGVWMCMLWRQIKTNDNRYIIENMK